jgi:hypothetical protein
MTTSALRGRSATASSHWLVGRGAANPMNTLQDQVDQINDILNDFGKGGSLAQLRKSGGKVLQVP